MVSNAILRHWRTPFHRERRDDANLHAREVGTVCGDEIDLYLFVEAGVIHDAFFDGDACTICIGMASLTTEHVVGMSVEAARELIAADVFQLASDVKIPKARHGCALVAFKALQAALS